MLKSHNNCSGCAACSAVCPVNAISMVEDKEGFLYPSIDTNKCISCQKCSNICSSPDAKTGSYQYYAVQNMNQRLLKRSSSGGVIPAVIDAVLDEEGVAYSATYIVGKGGIWERIENASQIEKVQGSKYLQISLHRDVYDRIRNDLKAERKVVVIGTPCQISGLRKVLWKPDHNRLLLIDIICGGVVSPDVERRYEDYIKSRYKSEVVRRVFRGKQNGIWEPTYYSEDYLANSRTISYIGEENLYTRLYNSARLLRESCYRCDYTCLERVGDITVGDCWGIEKESFEFPNKQLGVSLVATNTEIGKITFDHLKNLFSIPLDNGFPVRRNKPLHARQQRPYMRNFAYFLLKIFPFNLASRMITYRYAIKKALNWRNLFK